MMVGGSFIDAWAQLKGGNNDLKLQASEVEDMIQELLQFESFSIEPNYDRDNLLLMINGKPSQLDEVGSGISQLILILTGSAINNPSYVLIDEPELNFHPKLQVEFMQKLLGYTRYGIMFATHSYGLARSVQTQGRMILVSRNNPTQPPKLGLPHHQPRLSELLGELGYPGLADLGTAKVLLVEGPNDIQVIKHFLRLLDKKVEEFIVLDLGGDSGITVKRKNELKEVSKICPLVSVIIDRDGDADSSEPKKGRNKFIEMCINELGFNVHMTDQRAIENYFVKHAIRKVFPYRKAIKALNKYEKLGDGPNKKSHWSKKKNLLIAEQMEKDDIKDTDLGEFLANL